MKTKHLLTTGLLALLTTLTPARAVTILHSFTGGASDGSYTYGSLTLSGAKLYGMTVVGGSSDAGALFSMNTDGTGFGLLHSFTGGTSDGGNPNGSLTLSGSKLYGMTNGDPNRHGTIFTVNTDGTGFSLLRSFAGGVSDGAAPTGTLTLLGSKLYGTTAGGGSNNTGTIFSMNTDGTGFSLLHSFDSAADGNGRTPLGSLTLSGATLYGMTNEGGTTTNGTIFGIATDGSAFGLLESFHGSFNGASVDGGNPDRNDLTRSDDGLTLYGMTYRGGTADKGVVFSKSIAPEPASAALLGLGALLLAARRRRSA